MVVQGPGDEKDGAEIWYGEDRVAEVYEKNGKIVVGFLRPANEQWYFDYEEFLDLLQKSKQFIQ